MSKREWVFGDEDFGIYVGTPGGRPYVLCWQSDGAYGEAPVSYDELDVMIFKLKVALKKIARAEGRPKITYVPVFRLDRR